MEGRKVNKNKRHHNNPSSHGVYRLNWRILPSESATGELRACNCLDLISWVGRGGGIRVGHPAEICQKKRGDNSAKQGRWTLQVEERSLQKPRRKNQTRAPALGFRLGPWWGTGARAPPSAYFSPSPGGPWHAAGGKLPSFEDPTPTLQHFLPLSRSQKCQASKLQLPEPQSAEWPRFLSIPPLP